MSANSTLIFTTIIFYTILQVIILIATLSVVNPCSPVHRQMVQHYMGHRPKLQCHSMQETGGNREEMRFYRLVNKIQCNFAVCYNHVLKTPPMNIF